MGGETCLLRTFYFKSSTRTITLTEVQGKGDDRDAENKTEQFSAVCSTEQISFVHTYDSCPREGSKQSDFILKGSQNSRTLLRVSEGCGAMVFVFLFLKQEWKLLFHYAESAYFPSSVYSVICILREQYLV